MQRKERGSRLRGSICASPRHVGSRRVTSPFHAGCRGVAVLADGTPSETLRVFRVNTYMGFKDDSFSLLGVQSLLF